MDFSELEVVTLFYLSSEDSSDQAVLLTPFPYASGEKYQGRTTHLNGPWAVHGSARKRGAAPGDRWWGETAAPFWRLWATSLALGFSEWKPQGPWGNSSRLPPTSQALRWGRQTAPDLGSCSWGQRDAFALVVLFLTVAAKDELQRTHAC